MIRRLLSFVGMVALASGAWAIPTILITQRTSDGKPSALGPDLAFYLSELLRQEYNVTPIVWSMTDPDFRAFAYDNLLPSNVDQPDDRALLRGLSVIKGEFAMVVSAVPSNDGFAGTIKVLSSSGRTIFERKSILNAMTESQTDREFAERSMARTWALEMRAGFMKPHVKKVDTSTPPADPPIKITPVETSQTLQTSNAELRTRVETLQRTGDSALALALLYDAVDSRPNDVERRIMLIEELQNQGRFELAAQESNRALAVDPSSKPLRMAQLRALVQSGQYDVASAQINDARTRFPEDPEVIELAADLEVMAGRYEVARDAYLSLLAKKPSARVQARLALAIALTGDTAEVKVMMEGAKTLSPLEARQLYAHFLAASRRAVSKLTIDLQESIRTGRIKIGDGANKIRAQRAYKSVQGLDIFASLVPIPAPNESSHKNLALAHKLLVQACAEILAFVNSGDADMADEATLTLTEALKTYHEANPSPQG